jgi:hypothetical protein
VVLGVVAMYRQCLDVWGAFAVVLDHDAAPLLADRIDRSPARDVVGYEQDLVPLLPHTRRLRETWEAPSFRVSWPIPASVMDGTIDPRSRCATPADLEQLVALYEHYELDDIPTRFQLRRSLRRALRDGLPIVVVEVEGHLVAAMRVMWESCRYMYLSDETVLPEYRGRGYSRIFSGLLSQISVQNQRGFLGQSAATNPVEWSHKLKRRPELEAAVDPDARTVLTMCLRTPVLFRGQGRLRHAFYRVAGRRQRRPEMQYRERRR